MHARDVQDTYKVHPTYLSRSTHILGKMCSTIWCDHAKTSCKYHADELLLYLHESFEES